MSWFCFAPCASDGGAGKATFIRLQEVPCVSSIGVQEEGGASWSYSQGEIEDFLQSKQPLPPELQRLIDAR